MRRMCHRHFITRLIAALVLILNTGIVAAQLCPPNLDFENGTFSNWVCRTGNVTGSLGQNTINFTSTGEMFNRHTIIPASNTNVDPYGLFPVSCPNGSGYSIQLGNNQTGAQAEGVYYTYAIPATATTFSIIYYYAIVLQNPNHNSFEQPRFQARIVDESTNTDINCVSFDFTASSSLPGFQVSQLSPQVLYKGWTPITLDLGSYAGKTIRLEFTTSDCTQGGHFGYAYVDVNASCNGAVIGSRLCQGETTSTLIAPFGFQSYQWYSDNTFGTFLGSTQSLVLDPAPAIGAIYPVIVTPYPGFGCKDTLYAEITTAQKPVSVAGPDAIACRNQPFQIGGPPTTGYAYSWSPSLGLNNPASSSPYAFNNTFNSTRYILRTTDLATGCFSYDTTLISIAPVDTSILLAGKTTYCDGEPINAALSVGNGLTAIQWYRDNTPIPGAGSISYMPVTNGAYWAQVSQNGCTDSTRQQLIVINPLPQVSFTIDKDTQCVHSSFLLTNTTDIIPSQPMSYLWKFGDGTTDPTYSVTKTFDAPGNFTIELVASSIYGCKDSTIQIVTLMPNAEPDFVWDSICIDRPVQFRNLTNENGALLVNYEWDFKNGIISNAKTPSAFNYDTPGEYDVSLMTTTPGCENNPQTIVKKVWVNHAAKGIRYRDITLAEGYNAYITARDTVGKIYDWQPQVQLDNYRIRRPNFTASNDVKYLITITNERTCITVDTLQMLILKKPGVYLPSAFTPNGDGLNDVIKPYLVGMRTLKRFTIFNRSGNMVFSTTKPSEAWNGSFQNKPAEAGVYVWMIEYTSLDDKPQLAKGTITLIRLCIIKRQQIP